MTQVATNAQKTKLRSTRQSAKLYLACLQPPVIYTARLNGVPASTDMVAEITFDTGSGTLANVRPDMTLLVGSSAEDWDLGICRIRKAPIAGTFYISELSDIAWVDNCYLTVVEDYDLLPKHIHMSGDIPLMDYDVAYTDEHSDFNPVPVLGGHVVAELKGATVQVKIGPETGTASWVLDSSISSVLWSVPDATAISNVNATNPLVTFDAVGWHIAYCTVTAANGKTKTGVRWVYIWDQDNLPAEVTELTDFSESRDDGGIRFGVTVSYAATLQDIRDRSLCILFAVEYFDDVEGSVGHIEGQENILGIGRLDGSEDIVYDFSTSEVTFSVSGYQERFRQITGFPTGLEMQNTPAAWTDMPALTPRRAMWHFLEWRSTATVMMDVILLDDSRYASRLSSPLSNLWSQMEEIVFTTLLAEVFVDAHARLFTQVSPLLIPVAERTYPTVMDLKEFVEADVTLTRESQTRIAQVNLSGVSVTLGGTGNVFFSLSPGHVFSTFGSLQIVDRLLLVSQAQANQLAGLLYTSENNPYRLNVKVPGNNRLVTCFPNQAVDYDIAANETIRELVLNAKWIPVNRSITYDVENGFFETDLELMYQTGEGIGINGDVPGSGDFSIPPPLPSFPPMPSFPTPLPGGTGETGDGAPAKVIAIDRGSPGGLGLILTVDFNAANPNWFPINGGLTTVQQGDINRMIVCPNGAVYVGRVGGNAGTGGYFLARAPYAGGLFTIIEDQDSLNAKYPGYPGGTGIRLATFQCNPLASEEVVYLIYPQDVNDAVYDAYKGSGSTFVNTMQVTGVYSASASLSYGQGSWLLTHGVWPPNTGWQLIDAAFENTTDPGDVFGNITMPYHIRAGTSGKSIHWMDDNNGITLGFDNMGTIADGVNELGYDIPSVPQDSAVACDPTGTYLMTGKTTTGKGKSSDGGYSMVDMGGLAAVGAIWRFAYYTNLKWVAGSSYVMFTDDFGATWTDKRGNLQGISPFFQLIDVKVIP